MGRPRPVPGTAACTEETPVELGIIYNPCEQFDDPQTGCYYKWRPSDYCCVSPDPRCPAIC
jgi:hypothetical protein